MLRTISLRHFQSHEDTQVSFGEAFTAIVGSSNSGKSSIFRALKLVAQNSGAASGYVRSGEKALDVAVGLFDTESHYVSIQRGKSLSNYEVDGQEFAKCGVGTPELVTQTLKLSPTNFASQFDVPFMVAEFPTEVAARISALTGSDVLRSAHKEANRLRTEITRDLKDRRERFDTAMTSLKVDLPAWKAAEARWKAAEALAEQVEILRAQSRKLHTEASHARQLQRWLETNLTVMGDPEQALVLVEDAAVKVGLSGTLKSISSRIKSTILSIRNIEAELKTTVAEEIQLQKAIQTLMEGMDICPTCLQPMPTH